MIEIGPNLMHAIEVAAPVVAGMFFVWMLLR